MCKKVIDVVLDGEHSGVVAFLKKEKEIFKNELGISLFRNFETLNGSIYRSGLDYHAYKYQFCIDNNIIDLDRCIYNAERNIYIYYTSDTTILIREDIKERVVAINYIVTNKSYQKDSNEGNKYEFAKLKDLRKFVYTCVKNLSLYPYYGYRIIKDRYGWVLCKNNSSIKISIYTNANLIDYNVAAKEINERVLPFKKEMPKFGTLYTFITVDQSEANNQVAIEQANFFMQAIISYLAQCAEDFGYSDVKLIEVPFNGYKNYNRARKEEKNEFKDIIVVDY